MIFKPPLCCKVLAGEKVATRRPAADVGKCSYKPGTTYAVQPGRGKYAVARLRITTVKPQPLGWLSDREAHEEGFFSPQHFAAYWQSLYGGKYDDRRMVWVIRFELATPPNTCPCCTTPIEWCLTPDEKSVMAVDEERTSEGTIILSHRHPGVACTAVPQEPAEIVVLRKQAAHRGEDLKLFTVHTCA